MKKFIIITTSLLLFITACKKSGLEATVSPDVNQVNAAVKAKVNLNNVSKKVWATATKNIGGTTPVAGEDYFASRGGIDASELTLISFGKFTDDLVNPSGRLTIYLRNVTETGSYIVGGTSVDYAVLTIDNGIGTDLEHYATDRTNPGVINITKYDEVNSTISGNFSFQAAVPGKVIKVENGSFADVPFK